MTAGNFAVVVLEKDMHILDVCLQFINLWQSRRFHCRMKL